MLAWFKIKDNPTQTHYINCLIKACYQHVSIIGLRSEPQRESFITQGERHGAGRAS